MKITVAMRVIGGFAFITLLLFIISISSLSNLNSISSATEEVNNLALPTLTGSSNLKLAFVSMGRMTFSGYYEEDVATLETKSGSFQTSKSDFEKQLKTLESVVSKEANLRNTLNQVEATFQQYHTNVSDMFNNRLADLQLMNTISSQMGDVEDGVDDTSTLILDFSDLDEVQDNDALQAASDVGSQLEETLLSLMTVAEDYTNTEDLTKAETIGNELTLLMGQVNKYMADMETAADGNDDSGSIEEIMEMVETIGETINGSNGLLTNQVERLNKQIQATTALQNSDADIQNAIVQLDSLLKLANDKSAAVKDDVDFAVSSGNTSTIIIMIVSFFAAGGIGYFSVRAITVPLHKVNEMLNFVSGGDLTQRLDDSSQDEFGVLAKNCNNLVDRLKELISGIESRAVQLATASEETSAVTAQSTTSIDEQKSQVAQAATATTELNSTAALVADSAEDCLNQIRNADDQAKNVRIISNQNKETIETLAKEVDQAAEVINKLEQDSTAIGSILDVIRGIAEQTNLLALNAAIEAARAGEQGRGFAVVADEVRTLASRTQESTQEINNMIDMLQQGAERAVAVMGQSKQQTENCVEKSEEAASALDLITEAVHQAHDASTQIEQAAREQSVVSQDISRKLENIVDIAEETSKGAEQTSSASHEVAKLAEELQGSIRQFKV